MLMEKIITIEAVTAYSLHSQIYLRIYYDILSARFMSDRNLIYISSGETRSDSELSDLTQLFS